MRPSSRASTKSAFSTRSGVTAETEEERKVTEGAGGGGAGGGGKKKKRSKGTKKQKEIPRPDTGKDPCKVQEDIAWVNEQRGQAI